jgi:hypothetical protein
VSVSGPCLPDGRCASKKGAQFDDSEKEKGEENLSEQLFYAVRTPVCLLNKIYCIYVHSFLDKLYYSE